MLLIQFVNNQSRAKFRLEPGSFWRHNQTTVSNIDKLFHANGIEGKSYLHFTTVNPFFKLAQSANTTHKIDTL